MWTVIIFLKDNTIEVVPIKWLIGENEELCYWPPKENIKSLIISGAQPSDSWEVYGVRFPNNRKKTFDNFLKARSACSALAEDSEMVSDEGTDKRKRKKKNFSSSEEEDHTESSLPPPPSPPPLPKNSMSLVQTHGNRSIKPKVDKQDLMMAGMSNNRIPSASSSPFENSQNHYPAATATSTCNERQDRATIPLEDDGEAIDHEFPLKTLDAIENFESTLQNKEYASKFTHYISLLGGDSNWEAVRRAMERCFTDDVAQLFSWHGMKGKKPFGSLKFAKGVIEGIRKNSQFKNETDASLEKSIKSWLRHAKKRINKKKLIVS